jgi:hypothetical protein
MTRINKLSPLIRGPIVISKSAKHIAGKLLSSRACFLFCFAKTNYEMAAKNIALKTFCVY